MGWAARCKHKPDYTVTYGEMDQKPGTPQMIFESTPQSYKDNPMRLVRGTGNTAVRKERVVRSKKLKKLVKKAHARNTGYRHTHPVPTHSTPIEVKKEITENATESTLGEAHGV